MSEQVLERLDAVERQLHTLKREVDDIRASVVTPRPQVRATATTTPPPPRPERVVTRRPPEARPPRPKREIDYAELFGPRTLAWAGGAVTALGVVFLFALAVNRGWIGPEARVAIGALVSAAIFAGGFEIRRRYGKLYAAAAAVGAGIAGGYATLLAAAGLYDLVPEPLALALAGAIAAGATAVALSWNAQALAGLGLVGALAVPILLLADTDGPTRLGTSFAALMLAACATVGVARGWRAQLGAAAALAGGEALGLFLWDDLSPSLMILAGAICAIYLATGIAWQLVRGGTRVGGTTSTFVLGSAAFAWASVAALYTGESHVGRGGALLGAAAVYGVLAVATYRPRRDLGVLLAVVALMIGAVGVADALSNGSVTYAWAAEAAALALLASLLRERRFQVLSLAYLALATAHAFTTEARLDQLFEPFRHPAHGVPSLVALALAALVVARTARFDDADVEPVGVFAALRDVLAGLRAHTSEVQVAAVALSGLLVADASGRTTLALAQRRWDGVEHAFANGHVAVTGLWSIGGLALAVAGALLAKRSLLAGGIVWTTIVAVKAVGFDTHLDGGVWPWSFALVAAALLAVATILELRPLGFADATAYASAGVVAAFAYATASAAGLLEGRELGFALLGLAVAAAALAAPVLRTHRTFATTAWTVALVLAAVGDALVVDGQWRTLLWAGTAAALPWVAHATRERRLQLGAAAYGVLALADAVGTHAPPTDFVHAAAHPGSGVPAVAVAAAAIASFAAAAFPVRAEARDETDRELDRVQPTWRKAAWWIAGGAGLYAVSLAILELAERVRPDGITSAFQGGHTAVSALWGALGLALLYLGLRRAGSSLRLAGLVLFGVSLGKLFLYDLSRLSSITRAVSFLAVGAVLLLGGLLYQQLGDSRTKEIADNGI